MNTTRRSWLKSLAAIACGVLAAKPLEAQEQATAVVTDCWFKGGGPPLQFIVEATSARDAIFCKGIPAIGSRFPLPGCCGNWREQTLVNKSAQIIEKTRLYGMTQFAVTCEWRVIDT